MNNLRKIHNLVSLRSLALLSTLEGGAALILSLRTPSESKNAFAFGLSKGRLAITALTGIALLLWVILTLVSKRLEPALTRRLRTWRLGAVGALWLVVEAVLFGSFSAFFFAFGPIRSEVSAFRAVLSHGAPLVVWIALLSIQAAFYVSLIADQNPFQNDRFRWLSAALILGLLAFAFHVYDDLDWNRTIAADGLMFLPSAFCALGFAIWKKDHDKPKELNQLAAGILEGLFIFTLVYAFHRLVSFSIVRTNSPSHSYWPELADAFLNQRLYLINPSTNHDLTLFEGNWYVPNPPMPALVLMPFVAIFGINGVNTTVVSAVLGTANVLLLIWILRTVVKLGWFELSDNAIYWLAATFAVGTNHLWLVTLGQMWFVSQLLTVFFVSLSIFAALRGWSPLWAGFFLGSAMLCRPNVAPIALFLAGIELTRLRTSAESYRSLNWRRFFVWGFLAALPVLLSIAASFYYNWIRFGDWRDFGYVTINGAPVILEAVRTYGMFHPHFIKLNFETMIFALPRIVSVDGRTFLRPGVVGYSIFAMTPPILYAFRRWSREPWFIGAWASILSCVAMLLLYHNTGAEQIGYRYLMDFAVPLWILIGFGMKGRASRLFKLLMMLGTLVNAASMVWWYFLR